MILPDHDLDPNAFRYLHYPVDGSVSRLHGFKSQLGADYPFQFAMIAFNDVIPVLNLSVLNVRRAPTFAFEQRKRTTIGRSFIRIDESRNLPLLHVV